MTMPRTEQKNCQRLIVGCRRGELAGMAEAVIKSPRSWLPPITADSQQVLPAPPPARRLLGRVPRRGARVALAHRARMRAPAGVWR